MNYLEYWTLTCYVSIVGSDLLIPVHFFFPLHCQSRADTASSSEALSFKKVDRLFIVVITPLFEYSLSFDSVNEQKVSFHRWSY